MSKNIDTIINKAINSFDGAQRAQAKPYLFSRIKAKLQNEISDTRWDIILKFMSRPAIAYSFAILVIVINALVLINNFETKKIVANEDQYTTAVEFNTSVVALNDFDNIKP